MEVDPASSEVTRLLCQAVYARPDRVKMVKAWWRKIRGKRGKAKKPRRSTRRPIYLEGSDDCPTLGEPTAQWVVDHVLHGPPLPVPSYGFDLVPVTAHSLRARRRRWARRACILILCGLVAYAAPCAFAIWAAAVIVALFLRWAAFRAIRKVGRTRWAPSRRVAYVVLLIPWLLALIPYEPAGGDALELRFELALLPFGLAVVVALVYAADRLVARAALGALAREGVSSDGLPWAAAKARHRMTEIGKAQSQLALPYDALERFVGAGRDVWGPARISIPLQPKDAEESVRPFGEAELLRCVGIALKELGRGAREITDPLPGFSMERILGLPAARWLQRTRETNVELSDLIGLGRRSPSGVPDRLYLRAQCISWDGQIVVSVFVHAALEAGELRLTIRPHVITPLYNELRVADLPARTRGARLLRWLAAQSLLDTLMGPLAVWRLVARLGEKAEGRVEEEAPVSLRDRYSTEEVTDMHQGDDAKRHVVLMQSCVFRTVAEYLDEQGIDLTAYERQVAAVTNNILVYGDNNAPIQNVAGSGISGVGQDNKNQGDK
ncbi:hypothetical protein [Streptomyces roseifaciens]|uniref:hypothetical protein n=1 Tax=Streptomyces roseifaciens TaxID=1488406 RepID=UPI000A4D0A5E|nr:hypothetical protein [Streptomyces roseifaciens]